MLRNRLRGPIPQGTLLSRISALDEGGVQAVLAYEQEHGDRLPVVEVLRHRIEALRNGAKPSGAVQQDMPEVTGVADRITGEPRDDRAEDQPAVAGRADEPGPAALTDGMPS